MNKPKNQHWVPKVYLRQFATPATRSTTEPQVWVFSGKKVAGNEYLANVRNVCAKRFLYSPVDDRGERDFNLETKLAKLESAIARIWPHVANDFADLTDPTIRTGLALFIAVMHLRHPNMREFVEAEHAAFVKYCETLPADYDGVPNVESVDIRGVRNAFDKAGWHSYRNWNEVHHDRHFASFVESGCKDIAKCLIAKRWSVMFAERDVFVTSDKPVALRHGEKTVFGFASPGVLVTFPLSPTRMLVMDDKFAEPANQYYPVIEENIGGLNLGTWHSGNGPMITGRPIHDVLTEIVRWSELQDPPLE